MNEVLKIKDLKVSFHTRQGTVEAVRGVTLSVKKGEILALVGESGSGKSVTARSVLKLNDGGNVQTTASELFLGEKNILEASEKEMTTVRGSLAGMIFQDPMTCLNPTMKVGKQITEMLYRRGRRSADECRREAVRLLELVQIPQASLRAEQYPHQYSGGMRQRAMIAMALACEPKLLIADEPTTALDPTVQLQILRLLKKLQKEIGMAVLIITHDLSVVAALADKVAVMYGGKIVEEGTAADLFKMPQHPYTKGLLESLPTRDKRKALRVIQGTPPDMHKPPTGCAFAARCDHCMKICIQKQPPDITVKDEHNAACWLLHPDCPKGGEE